MCSFSICRAFAGRTRVCAARRLGLRLFDIFNMKLRTRTMRRHRTPDVHINYSPSS